MRRLANFQSADRWSETPGQYVEGTMIDIGIGLWLFPWHWHHHCH
jgi:hypothetical protein